MKLKLAARRSQYASGKMPGQLPGTVLSLLRYKQLQAMNFPFISDSLPNPLHQLVIEPHLGHIDRRKADCLFVFAQQHDKYFHQRAGQTRKLHPTHQPIGGIGLLLFARREIHLLFRNTGKDQPDIPDRCQRRVCMQANHQREPRLLPGLFIGHEANILRTARNEKHQHLELQRAEQFPFHLHRRHEPVAAEIRASLYMHPDECCGEQ